MLHQLITHFTRVPVLIRRVKMGTRCIMPESHHALDTLDTLWGETTGTETVNLFFFPTKKKRGKRQFEDGDVSSGDILAVRRK